MPLSLGLDSTSLQGQRYIGEITDIPSPLGSIASQGASIAIASIHDLPPEVMAEIFMEWVALDNDWTCGYSSLHRDRAPMLATRICRRWRDIALDTPMLWKTLAISTPAQGPDKKLFEVARAWALRARCGLEALGLKTCPDDEDVETSCVLSDRDHSFLQVTVECSTVFASLTRLFLESVPTAFLKSLGRGLFPNLERLALSLFLSPESANSEDEVISAFQDSLLLRRCVFRNVSTKISHSRTRPDSLLFHLELPWDQLTHYYELGNSSLTPITLVMASNNVQYLLATAAQDVNLTSASEEWIRSPPLATNGYCQRVPVEELTIVCWSGERSQAGPELMYFFPLPKLRVLRLICKTLDLYDESWALSRPDLFILKLKQLSTLERLSLTTPTIPRRSLVRILDAAATIGTLDIHFTHDLRDYITLFTEIRASSLLPNLHTIYLYWMRIGAPAHDPGKTHDSCKDILTEALWALYHLITSRPPMSTTSTPGHGAIRQVIVHADRDSDMARAIPTMDWRDVDLRVSVGRWQRADHPAFLWLRNDEELTDWPEAQTLLMPPELDAERSQSVLA